MRFERPFNSVQPPVQHQCGLEFTLLPQRAFPDDRHSPSGFEQMVLVAPVSAHVGMELGPPEFLASGRGGGVRAPDVTVPEAAVNEAHGSEPTKHEIGGTREVAVVQAVPQTAGMESTAKNEFGYSVPASNPRHHPRTGHLVHYVRHLSLPHRLRGILSQTNLARDVEHDQVCEHTSSPGPGGAACVDSGPGVQVGPRVRSPHSRPERPIRVLTDDGEHIFTSAVAVRM